MADSKWGGIAEHADELVMQLAREYGWAVDGERYRKSVAAIEAELRRRVEPLLVLCHRITLRPTVALSQDGEELRKELESWRK